ncbi:MBL fold metallo-hydrolase [candidate division KSB1 bacterium]|nr:MBL fold metallo-hydrolase [candidate division KSB1 bacterium]
MKLILLGSGAVRPDLDHWGPAQVVQVGGENLLFDCGRGATMRLVQAGIPIQQLKRLFFTHHHFDHNCDFAYLFLSSWVLGRDVPMEIVGPRGTQAFCDALLKSAYRDDIDTRRFHPMYSAHGCKYNVRDVLEDELTLEYEGFRIRMVHVLHKSHILDNLAYRIEADGKSIVIVGDTTMCQSLMNLAEGADLMVHECTFPTARIRSAKWESFHTAPRDLGKWAKARGVKVLVLKHYAIQPGVEIETMFDEVKAEFGDQGLIAGHDLMTLEV